MRKHYLLVWDMNSLLSLHVCWQFHSSHTCHFYTASMMHCCSSWRAASIRKINTTSVMNHQKLKSTDVRREGNGGDRIAPTSPIPLLGDTASRQVWMCVWNSSSTPPCWQFMVPLWWSCSWDITEMINKMDWDFLSWIWLELDYCCGICSVTKGTPVKCL